MRDFQLPGRSTAYGQNGMAATSHPLATLAALDVLRAGGNAVDAAVAAVAVQGVVEPLMTGIGGDCFVLVAPAGGEVAALNGSGCAPAAATVERLQAQGLSRIEQTSAHAVTVPGAVDGWATLLERFGTRGLAELLQPAIAYAEDGFPVTPRVAWDWASCAGTVRASPAGAAYYLPDGKAPAVGRLHRLPALARTLRWIAEEGRDGFYEGEPAARMVRSLKSMGGLHTLEDFARQRALWVEPIRTSYRGVEVVECPPNGQGIITLLMLNILEGFDLAGLDPNGALRLHLEAEATRLAFRDRDRLIADPTMVEVPVGLLLDKAYAERLRAQIDRRRAMAALPPPLLEPHPDTVYLTVVDRERNAVSFINSIYDGFGSGLVCPDTGVLFHSRGRSFRLDARHPNALAPRKRPMHTIIPAMALKDGRLWMSFGVKGGDYQPVGQTHVLTGMVDFGQDPQAAIDAPRAMAYPDGLQLERGIGEGVARELAAMGHRVLPAEKPLGVGQAIVVDHEAGMLIGGSDARSDGLALGY